MKFLRMMLAGAILSTSLTTQALAVPINAGSPEYSVSVATTQTGTNQWRFDYTVTNHENTGLNYWSDGRNYYGYSQGFAGFHVEIPQSAIFVSATNPAPYVNDGSSHWANYRVTDLSSALYHADGSIGNAPENPLNSGNDWYIFWAGGWGSPYPKEIPVSFSLELGNIAVGTVDATLTSFWGFDSDGDGNSPIFTYTPSIPDTYYSMYSAAVTGAVALPSGPSPVPEPGTLMLLGSGLVGLIGARRQKQK
ncbi:MAG: PEP-CTERM sorting domain-containing protein [Desulfobulbaceae bacterium]|nr:PEP-CTERM sorting domain-containing protein [Desulfobulbaceae bacterium]